MSEPNKRPRPLPRDLDETEQRLNAEFYQCDHEHTIAKEKITNPRQSMLHASYVALRKAADAIEDTCDQIRVKIGAHRKAMLDKAELPEP